MSIQNIAVRPMYVYIGKDTAQVQTITTVADVAGSLGGKYFLIHTPTVKHYVWFNTGSSVDPAPAGGWTEIEVAITSGASALLLQRLCKGVLDVFTGFNATVSGNVVTVTNVATGYAQPAIDADSGFAFKSNNFRVN